ncbi:MAG: type II toxin-antitoxin system VapC family toxin [Actinomycetota bacterium]
MTAHRAAARNTAGLLLDTHIWFWYLTGSRRLPAGVRRAIDRSAEPPWLSPISIWELGVLTGRGRVRLDVPLRRWIADAREAFPLQDAPLNDEIALRSLEISLPHRDPADHFLAATALVYHLTLATLDDRLIEADWLPTRST